MVSEEVVCVNSIVVEFGCLDDVAFCENGVGFVVCGVCWVVWLLVR